jgi:hypothetical protein
MYPPALEILLVYPVIPDQGIAHQKYLASVTWVGQCLLVPGHGGVEYKLSLQIGLRSESPPMQNGSILQHQGCLESHHIELGLNVGWESF